jgi:hypothetical protein
LTDYRLQARYYYFPLSFIRSVYNKANKRHKRGYLALHQWNFLPQPLQLAMSPENTEHRITPLVGFVSF